MTLRSQCGTRQSDFRPRPGSVSFESEPLRDPGRVAHRCVFHAIRSTRATWTPSRARRGLEYQFALRKIGSIQFSVISQKRRSRARRAADRRSSIGPPWHPPSLAYGCGRHRGSPLSARARGRPIRAGCRSRSAVRPRTCQGLEIATLRRLRHHPCPERPRVHPFVLENGIGELPVICAS